MLDEKKNHVTILSEFVFCRQVSVSKIPETQNSNIFSGEHALSLLRSLLAGVMISKHRTREQAVKETSMHSTCERISFGIRLRYFLGTGKFWKIYHH